MVVMVKKMRTWWYGGGGGLLLLVRMLERRGLVPLKVLAEGWCCSTRECLPIRWRRVNREKPADQAYTNRQMYCLPIDKHFFGSVSLVTMKFVLIRIRGLTSF